MATDNTRARRFYERGVYFYQIDRMADAVVNLRDAVELMPEHFAARSIWGRRWASRRNISTPLMFSKKVASARPWSMIDSSSSCSTCWPPSALVRQDFPAAKYYIDAALKLFPNSPLLQNMRASVLCRDGKFEEGLDAFMRAMEQSTLPQELVE